MELTEASATAQCAQMWVASRRSSRRGIALSGGVRSGHAEQPDIAGSGNSQSEDQLQFSATKPLVGFVLAASRTVLAAGVAAAVSTRLGRLWA